MKLFNKHDQYKQIELNVRDRLIDQFSNPS